MPQQSADEQAGESAGARTPRRRVLRAAGAGALGLGLGLGGLTLTALATPGGGPPDPRATPGRRPLPVPTPEGPSSEGPSPEGPGSVRRAPHLPPGFTKTFTSRYIDIGGVRLHAVIGGDGPPLLLVHGWPETWYAWRLLMPELARNFTVVAVDQRGAGLSDKPRDGYDTGTLARDMVALMEALGYQRFAMVGHDTGMPIGYALAADHPERLDCLAVAEAVLPGATASPPLLGSSSQVNNKLWHISPSTGSPT